MHKFDLERTIITVRQHQGLWAVEEGGVYFGGTPDKEIAKASATKRARLRIAEGRSCQIRVSGEHGFAI